MWNRCAVRAVRILFAAAAVVASASPALAQDTPPLTLAGALERALAANPTIAAARLRGAVDVAGVSVASERPNPEVAYELSKETPRQSIGATVPIELGGKRDRRIDLANATVTAGAAELARVVAEVRVQVRRAYFEVVASTARMQIADDVRALAVQARDAASARAQAGDVPQSDVTQSELALATTDNDLIGARGDAAASRAALNALLGQRPDAVVVLADSLTEGAVMTTEEALSLARQANTEVRLMDRRIEEQVARINLARSATTQDMSAGGAFTYDAEPEFRYGWRITGAITIPVFTRHKAGVALEESTMALLNGERAALVARIEGDIAAAISKAAAARAQLDHYQASILPLAVEAERQAQAAYTGGQVGLSALIQALQAARDIRQRGLQAALDYQHAVADLEQAIGAAAPMTPTFQVFAASRAHHLSRWGIAAVLLAAAACAHESVEEVATEAAVPVVVATATTQLLQGTVSTTGMVAPSPGAELIVLAPESARVAEIPKAEGDAVREGDVLVRFDIPTLAADVSARQAGVVQATARLEEARSNFTRLSSLLAQGVAAPREVEDAKRQQAEAEADVEQARSAVEAASALSSRTVVRATFSGVIAKRFHNPGDVVEASATDPVLTMINPARLQVVAAVPASDLSRVVVGHAARVRLDAGDDGEEARVSAKAPQIDPTNGTAAVRLAFQAPTSMTSGMKVQVEIVAEERKNALVIPVAALVADEGELFVMVAGADNKAHKYPVAIGLSTRALAEVTSGIKAGDRVIVRGQAGLPEGAAVTVEGQ